jgi:hypothetical protein
MRILRYRSIASAVLASKEAFRDLPPLPAEMVQEMWACSEPWCSGTHGRWYWERTRAQPEREVGYWPTQEESKPCGQPHGHRCGYNNHPEYEAPFKACPLRYARPPVLRNDSYLECVKFGSIRRRVPDLMARVGRYQPTHQYVDLQLLVLYVLQDGEGLSPHLHFPHTRHLREGGSPYDDPWDQFGRRAGCAQHWAIARSSYAFLLFP